MKSRWVMAITGLLLVVVGCAGPTVASIPAPAATPSSSPSTAGLAPPSSVPPPRSGQASIPPPPSGAAGTREPLRYAPPVSDPLDARGIAVCDLLTSTQLTNIGLDPRTAYPSVSGEAQVCTWDTFDGTNTGGITLDADRFPLAALDGIYVLNQGIVAILDPITVDGHPGFRGDDDPSTCTYYVAVADYQLIGVDGRARNLPQSDPCGPSKRMAELILSNLPPLKS